MYKPDPRIVKYLREYDRDLGARWNRDREQWEVTWNGKHAWYVSDDGGKFRPLDERVLTQAKLQDLWGHRSAQAMLKLQSEENHRLEGLGRSRQRDHLRQYIVEEGHQKVVGVGQFSGWSPQA